mmetsp:Transcript_51646/g.117606  ORF Transcript_51646/g.117606 Transcript_51646/m.117606 type:complete len:573 (-) Transcript_51646:417-2135(-)
MYNHLEHSSRAHQSTGNNGWAPDAEEQNMLNQFMVDSTDEKSYGGGDGGVGGDGGHSGGYVPQALPRPPGYPPDLRPPQTSAAAFQPNVQNTYGGLIPGSEPSGFAGLGVGDLNKAGDLGSKRRSQEMTLEDKEKVTRDRNREHARNTRLRKKAYEAKLSQMVMDLTAQREQQARERALAATMERERLSIRQGVVRQMLDLRAAGDADVMKWMQIVDESFVCTMPITPFRSFQHAEVNGVNRVLRGLDAFIADVRSEAICVESIGAPSPRWKAARARGERVSAQYALVDLAVAEDSLMAKWVFATRNAVSAGAECECRLDGMLRCTFTPQNKILSAEFSFDVMALMQQLQCAATPADSMVQSEVPIVPNTLQMASLQSQECRVITSARPPYQIVQANPAWTQLCGYASEEVEGRNLGIMQGPATDRAAVARFMADVHAGRPAAMTVTNYKKDGRPFDNYVRVYPLSSSMGSSGVTHLMALLEELPPREQRAQQNRQGLAIQQQGELGRQGRQSEAHPSSQLGHKDESQGGGGPGQPKTTHAPENPELAGRASGPGINLGLIETQDRHGFQSV